jgi:hypothetical protein
MRSVAEIDAADVRLKERTQEVGIRKAKGASSSRAILLVLVGVHFTVVGILNNKIAVSSCFKPDDRYSALRAVSSVYKLD